MKYRLNIEQRYIMSLMRLFSLLMLLMKYLCCQFFNGVHQRDCQYDYSIFSFGFEKKSYIGIYRYILVYIGLLYISLLRYNKSYEIIHTS